MTTSRDLSLHEQAALAEARAWERVALALCDTTERWDMAVAAYSRYYKEEIAKAWGPHDRDV